MELVSTVTAALTGQLLLGAILYAIVARFLRPGSKKGTSHRRRWAGWASGSRALFRTSLFWFPLLVLALLSHAWRPAGIAGALRFWTAPWPFLAIGALPTSACFVMVHAALRERRGQVRSARRQVRPAGALTFFGSIGLLVLVWGDLFYRVPFRRAVLAGSPIASIAVTVGMACLGVGAFVSLLAGLSRKPRPSAYFGALLYFAGICGLVTAHDAALQGPAGKHPSTVADRLESIGIQARLGRFGPDGSPQVPDGGRGNEGPWTSSPS